MLCETKMKNEIISNMITKRLNWMQSKKSQQKKKGKTKRNEKGTDLSALHSPYSAIDVRCSKNMVLVRVVSAVYALLRSERRVPCKPYNVARKLPSKLICLNSWRSHMNKIKCLRVWHSQLQSQYSQRRRQRRRRRRIRRRQDIFSITFCLWYCARISSIQHTMKWFWKISIRFSLQTKLRFARSENRWKLFFVVPRRCG